MKNRYEVTFGGEMTGNEYEWQNFLINTGSLERAHERGIKTRAEFAPICPEEVYKVVKSCSYVDVYCVDRADCRQK